MLILVLNSGSSSIKYALFQSSDWSVLASGLVENIGKRSARLLYQAGGGEDGEVLLPGADHRRGFAAIQDVLPKDTSVELGAIGHRVVHGGETFHAPVLIDEAVIAAIEKLIPLAPLHNPANLMGIRLSREYDPQIPQVAVFDTAFHQSIPQYGYLYALPYRLYETHKIRRYGFHGTSHSYVAQKAAHYLQKPLVDLNMITLHLGNGASAAAIRGGKCIDTSMGMTPLEGLIMGARSGDLDPAILFFLARETGMNINDLDKLLNKQSGLKGICGENDMRTITESAGQGDKRARLALSMFCFRIKKYIGAYIAVLGGADCIVFTGGIGENSAIVRQMSCQGLERLGICVDKTKNEVRQNTITEIQADDSAVKILVVPTNEELEIAIRTLRVVNDQSLARSDSVETRHALSLR